MRELDSALTGAWFRSLLTFLLVGVLVGGCGGVGEQSVEVQTETVWPFAWLPGLTGRIGCADAAATLAESFEDDVVRSATGAPPSGRVVDLDKLIDGTIDAQSGWPYDAVASLMANENRVALAVVSAEGNDPVFLVTAYATLPVTIYQSERLRLGLDVCDPDDFHVAWREALSEDLVKRLDEPLPAGSSRFGSMDELLHDLIGSATDEATKVARQIRAAGT